MHSLNNRRQGFESKFALEGEQEFKAKAMASKLFALWAATEMHMEEEDYSTYIKTLIELGIHSQEIDPIIDHVKHDLSESGLDITKHKLENIFQEKLEICRAELLSKS